MKKILHSGVALLCLSITTQAYDTNKAQELDSFYSHMTQKACADSKLFVKAADVMKMLREDKPFTMLDVRTDSEASIVGLSGRNALHIPIDSLFKKINLDRLPTDKPIMIVCHSGIRATLAAIGLKQLGFKNVHVIKGGIIALSTVDTPKNAPMK